MSYQKTLMQDAAGATGNGTTMGVKERGGAIHFENIGSPVGTVTFEGALNAAEDAFIAVPLETATGTLVTSTTTPGYFRLPLNHGLAVVRARISAFTSGAFSIHGATTRR
jgi:hypothetical protein